MTRPGLLLGQPEAPQRPRQAGRMQPLAPETRDHLGQRGQRPLRAAIAGEVGASEHELLERHALRLVQHWPAMTLGAVVEPGQALRIVAHHRVVQRLPLHTRKPRRLRTALALQRMGDRMHPRRRPRVLPPSRQGAQLRRAQIRPDRQCHDHRLLPPRPGKGITKPTQRKEPIESAQALAGIKGGAL